MLSIQSPTAAHTCWLMMLMIGRLTILASCSRREWWQAASVTCQQASPQPKQAAERGQRVCGGVQQHTAVMAGS